MNGLENIRTGALNAPNRGILRTESISRSVLWVVENYHTLQNVEHSLCSDIFKVPMFPNCFIYLSLNFENDKYLLRINRLVRNRTTFNALCSTIKIKFLIEDPSCDLCQTGEMEIPNEDLSCPVIINHISASSSVILPRLEIRCTVTINVSSTPFKNPADLQKKMKDYTTNMSSQELHEHLDVLLADDKDSKVVLRVGEEFFNVHKTLLCSHSPVFAAMFKHEMLEKSQSEICMNDITPSTVGEILKYIYFHSIGAVSIDEVTEVYVAADKYAMTDLKKLCSENMARNLSKDNLLRILQLADRHVDKDLEVTAINFLVKEGTDIIETEEFLTFIENDSELTRKIMRQLIKVISR